MHQNFILFCHQYSAQDFRLEKQQKTFGGPAWGAYKRCPIHSSRKKREKKVMGPEGKGWGEDRSSGDMCSTQCHSSLFNDDKFVCDQRP